MYRGERPGDCERNRARRSCALRGNPRKDEGASRNHRAAAHRHCFEEIKIASEFALFTTHRSKPGIVSVPIPSNTKSNINNFSATRNAPASLSNKLTINMPPDL